MQTDKLVPAVLCFLVQSRNENRKEADTHFSSFFLVLSHVVLIFFLSRSISLNQLTTLAHHCRYILLIIVVFQQQQSRESMRSKKQNLIKKEPVMDEHRRGILVLVQQIVLSFAFWAQFFSFSVSVSRRLFLLLLLLGCHPLRKKIKNAVFYFLLLSTAEIN